MSQVSPTLETIPIELRRKIYGYFLIARCKSSPQECREGKCESPYICYDGKYGIRLSIGRFTGAFSLDTPILRASKMTNLQGPEVLYGQNVFYTSCPKSLEKFLARIGPINAALLTTIRLFIPGNASRPPNKADWLDTVQLIAERATALKTLTVHWFEYGLSGDVDFVRALGQIRGLGKIEIGGYYGAKWPRYLEEQLGAKVVELPGNHQIDQDETMDTFREFQERTRDRNP